MTDSPRTHQELVEEISFLKQRIQELEHSESERMRMEQAYKDSELKYRSLIEHSSDVVFCVDQNGEYKFVNQVFASTFGQTPDYFLGKTFWDIYPKEHADHRQAASSMVFATGESQSVEVVVPLQDRTLYFIAKANPLRDETGKVVLNLTHATDITERKHAEEALRAKEEELKSILDSIPAAIFYKDKSGRHIMANKKLADLTGVPQDLWIGKTISELLPKFADEYSKADMEVINTGKIQIGIEEKYEALEGTGWVLTNKIPYKDSQGNIIGLIGMSIDITDRKASEDALRESERRYRIIVETANEGIWSMDDKYRTTFVNKTMADMLGYEPDEMLGRRVDSFMFQEDLEDHSGKMEGRADGQDSVYERRFLRKNGGTLWTIVSAHALQNEQGKFAGSFAMFTDITERKRAEEALRESDEWHRTILHTAMDGFWLADMQGHLLEVNETYCRMSGYSKEELLTMSVSDLEAIELDAETAAHMQKVMIRGEDRFETWHHRKDGSVFEVEISVQYKPLQGGQLIAFLRDITDRKQAEEIVQKSEEKFSKAFHSSPILTAISTIEEGRFLDVNEIFLRTLSFSREEVIGKTSLELGFFANPVQRQTIRKITEEKGSAKDIEVKMAAKNGQIIDGLFSAEPITVNNEKCWLTVMVDVTEQKRAEKALHESEESFRILSEAAFEAIAIHEEGVLINANDQYFKMFGYEPGEALGKQMMSMTIAPEAIEFATKQIATDSLGPYESIGVRKDGTRFPIEVRARKMDYKGRNVRFGAIVDITKRKREEDELKSNRVQLSNAMEMAHLGHWEYDVANDLFTFNDPFYKMFRTTVEQVGGYTMQSAEYAHRFVHPDDMHMVGEETRKAIETTDPHFNRQIEHRMLYADGEVGYISVRFFIVKDSHGRTVKTYGVNQDITERKQAEQALRESEERYRMIFNSSPLGVMHFDSRGIIVDFNDKFAQIMGAPREKILMFNMLERLRDQAMVKAVEDALEGRIGYYEGDYLSVTGEKTTPMRAIYQKVTANDGMFLGAIGLFEDITERKRAEDEKTKIQDQLLQSQKMESVGRLAGGVAHDFNNMLGVILGHAELAIDKVDTGRPLLTDLHEIKKAAERSADLTRQLLAFARKQVVSPRVLDMNDTVAGMLNMLQRLIGEDIHMAWLPGINLWPVRMDPSQIDQILANLCVNSRDAIAGVGKVTIETGSITFDEAYCADHAGFIPGEYVLLAVSDNGCGMNKEILGNLFEPFFTTKETGKGTGLGLATVYGIVKQNNGFINVYSEPDQGTTFSIYLPRHIGKAEQARTEVRQEQVMRGHETVLVVEDEPSLLELSKLILETQGYRVLTAGTPGEAMRLAEEHAGEIHLLMTDVVMPEMNGRDLARKLLSLHPNLKRLFMSGYTANVIAHHGVLDDGVYFIQKPFSIKDLAAKVRETLDCELA